LFLLFKETKQVSLEDIDLLFGERALGTLPDDLHKDRTKDSEVHPSSDDVEAKPSVNVNES
jgi:hypothetical protein